MSKLKQIDFFDIVSLIGLAFFAVGTFLILPAICFISVGIILILFSFYGSRIAASSDNKEQK